MKRIGLAVLCALLLGATAVATAQEKRSSVGSDIVIASNESAGDVACVLCTVYVHGRVNGKVAVVMGDVVVDGTVNDKVAVVMGDLKVLPGGVVNGDVAIAAGGMENQGKINGEIKQSGNRHTAKFGVLVGLFFLLLPVAVVVLIVWLIVRAVRRPKYPPYPPPPPMHPPAR